MNSQPETAKATEQAQQMNTSELTPEELELVNGGGQITGLIGPVTGGITDAVGFAGSGGLSLLKK